MTVNQKNAGSGQQRQSVSLVMVSAKGRVAVYDMSLKLAAAFTLRLSSAPVASIKAPLSIPSAASRTSGSSTRPNATTSSTGITYNAGSSQKVSLFFSSWIDFKSRITMRIPWPLVPKTFFFFLFHSAFCISTCEKNVMISEHSPVNFAHIGEERCKNIFNPSASSQLCYFFLKGIIKKKKWKKGNEQRTPGSSWNIDSVGHKLQELMISITRGFSICVSRSLGIDL